MGDVTVLNVEGMSCGHCVMTVEKALASITGVKKVNVNLKKKEAKIVADKGMDTNLFVNAVSESGYTATVKK